MSIEYFGTPVPVLTSDCIKQLVVALSEIDNIRLIRKNDSEFGICFLKDGASELETAIILFNFEQVYVGFHACHGDDRKKVLEFLESKLENLGHVCQFKEE